MALAHWQRMKWMGCALACAGALAAAPAVPAGPAPKKSTAKYEIRFMKEMIDHHQMAVMTGELCQENAVSEDLILLCGEIVATQMEEIEQMQAWLVEWYGIEYEPQMSKQMGREMTMLAALEEEEFEIAFMEMMIKHHAGAIRSGRQCVRRAYHPELMELCEAIIEAQEMEIATMEMWLCNWYDICH